MEPTKGNKQRESGSGNEYGDAAPPSYDEAFQEGSQAAPEATDSKRSYNGPQEASEARPTVDSPFNFPPPYTASASYQGEGSSSSAGPSNPGIDGQGHSSLPIAGSSSGSGSSSVASTRVLLAIPQTTPQPTSPFLSAYNTPVLLRRGISSESFTSFLATLSAFLSATVPERALAHAVDVARGFNDIPKKFSKDTIAHVKGVGKGIGESAKKGNLIGAGIGVIAGAVALPVAAALRLVDATVNQLPAAVGGGLSKPLSPRERAEAYLSVAQKDWFDARGLTARLCNTAELLQLNAQDRKPGSGCYSGTEDAAGYLVDAVHKARGEGLDGQLQALENLFRLAYLEIMVGHPNDVKPLDIGTKTLWLVLTDVARGV